ncbi:MAG: cyclase family protein, partial [Sedimentisphaerales bacterium]|nr:cyclase family protein [Sedimentisphaerales bacterium]
MITMIIYDISIPISNATEPFPGDQPFCLHYQSKLTTSSEYELTWFEMSSHLGTHIDAPSHFIPGGKTIDQLDMSLFFGPARVIDCTNCQQAIRPGDLETYLADKPVRVILKTGNSNKYLLASTAEMLIDHKCRLLGIDQMCLEEPSDQAYKIHKTLLNAGLVILESLALGQIKAGDYFYAGAP